MGDRLGIPGDVGFSFFVLKCSVIIIVDGASLAMQGYLPNKTKLLMRCHHSIVLVHGTVHL